MLHVSRDPASESVRENKEEQVARRDARSSVQLISVPTAPSSGFVQTVRHLMNDPYRGGTCMTNDCRALRVGIVTVEKI